jgi:hypothetical protein
MAVLTDSNVRTGIRKIDLDYIASQVLSLVLFEA